MSNDALDLLQQFARGSKRRTKRDRERDLAAEVRTLRTERDEERMAGHIHSKAADELAQTCYRLRGENEKLQTRLAELEPDARLGKMVREMPREYHLIHSVYGTWWYGRNVRGEFGKTGKTPETALEAARKGDPC